MMKILGRLRSRLRIVEFGAGFSVGIILVSIGGVCLDGWKIITDANQIAQMSEQYGIPIVVYHQDVRRLNQDQESRIRGQVAYVGLGLLGAMSLTAFALAASKTTSQETTRRHQESTPSAPPPPPTAVIPDTVWMRPPDDPAAPGL